MQDKKTRLGGVVARFAAPLSRELERLRREQRDQAHIATLGDRPFAGCQPCKPSSPQPSAEAADNAPATRRGD